MRLGPWVIAALLLFAAWRLYSLRDIDHVPGVLAAADPEQYEIDDAAGIERGSFVLRPRAEFSATVRVLAREDYSIGDLAQLVPTDFAVGWGPMSDSTVLEDIEIRQANRFYFWRTRRWPLSRRRDRNPLGQLACDPGYRHRARHTGPAAGRQHRGAARASSWTSKAGRAA